jgi:3-hydroxybutyryl-CoA dehydrogenase
VNERLSVVGSGVIACGLASTAARSGDVLVLARSEDSAARAAERVQRAGARADDPASADRVRFATRLEALEGTTYVIEAIVEDRRAKADVLAEIAGRVGEEAILATTTSSLAVADLARATGRPDRFAAFHVFNPVPRMPLVELAFPPEASAETRARTRALSEALGKTPVEVPDEPGFVVNRLLFPFLFDAVRLMERTGIDAETVDTCMRLGASQPMGPLALLDFVGLDVALAIGESIEAEVPARMRELVAEGALGRKAGRGFHRYPDGRPA